MPRQNEIDIALTAEQLTAFDTLLTGLEAATAAFPTLAPAEKLTHVKPPETADGWMTGLLTRAEQNLQRLPRDLDPVGIRRDLTLAFDLGPRQLRVARVLDRLDSARFLARSDAFAELLSVRRALKEAGLTGVDDNLDDGLQRFFNRGSKSTPPTPAPAG